MKECKYTHGTKEEWGNAICDARKNFIQRAKLFPNKVPPFN